MPTDEIDLVSTAEAADLLGVSVWTVLRMVAAGRLEVAAQAPGLRGARLFHRADVEALRTEARSA